MRHRSRLEVYEITEKLRRWQTKKRRGAARIRQQLDGTCPRHPAPFRAVRAGIALAGLANVSAHPSYVELSDFDIEIFEDETAMFVADTLKAVVEVASMNEQYVLPMAPLPTARPLPLPIAATSPRHRVRFLEKEDVMCAMPTPIEPMLLRETAPIAPRARSTRWPVLLCAFIASVFAGAALMQSPLSKNVHHAIKTVKKELAVSLGT